MTRLPALDASEYTINEQLEKISEETCEVFVAHLNDNREELIAEVMDLRQACFTMLDVLGATEQDENRHYYKMKSYEAQGKYKLKGRYEIKFIPEEE